ncbi:MAG TPA: hypothetical protein VG327_09185 [Mycobacterium sp.]|nr:hypothetical protein [Mycobacterium sp.]
MFPQAIDVMEGGNRQRDQHRKQDDHQDCDDAEHFFSLSPEAEWLNRFEHRCVESNRLPQTRRCVRSQRYEARFTAATS